MRTPVMGFLFLLRVLEILWGRKYVWKASFHAFSFLDVCNNDFFKNRL
ncbi:hypothetical protein BREVNS_0299 [Brevinematales bacterium NS]|nr:hypothetical protein BREVNS_0299 [Brevinematales bacterium NS]